nr:DeoR family transcriptional regulator [Bacillus licheniformis]
MLPIKRREQILAWIKEEESLRISEISKRLNVSEMTVYRDIKPLVENGQVIKTAGGITLNKPKQSALGDFASFAEKGQVRGLPCKLSKTTAKLNSFAARIAQCSAMRK